MKMLSFVCREMQMKTTRRNCLTPGGMAKKSHHHHHRLVRTRSNRNSSWWEYKMVQPAGRQFGPS
jgi:hypothetical protein